MTEPRSAIRRLTEDHREQRPSTTREAVIYAFELVAAFGLFARVASHVVVYGALHEDEDIHPLDIEWGWTPGLAVEADATGATPTQTDRARVQVISGLFWAGICVSAATSATIGMTPVAAVLFAPSVAVLVGDPIYGAVVDYRRSQTNG